MPIYDLSLDVNPTTTSTTSLSGTSVLGIADPTGVGLATTGLGLLGIDPTTLISDTFSSTLGNVLANGLNLSCWGSSYSPAEARKEAPVHVQQKLELSGFLQNPSTETLNQFRNFIYQEIYGLELYITRDYASCTKDGWRTKIEYMDTFAKDMLVQLQNKGLIVQSIGQQKVQYLQGSVYGQIPELTQKTFEAFSLSKPNNSSSSGITLTDQNGNVIAETKSGFNPAWLLLLGLI